MVGLADPGRARDLWIGMLGTCSSGSARALRRGCVRALPRGPSHSRQVCGCLRAPSTQCGPPAALVLAGEERGEGHRSDADADGHEPLSRDAVERAQRGRASRNRPRRAAARSLHRRRPARRLRLRELADDVCSPCRRRVRGDARCLAGRVDGAEHRCKRGALEHPRAGSHALMR